MCELLALVANRKVAPTISWRGLQVGASIHKHGWGAAWLDDNQFSVTKKPVQLPAGKAGLDLIAGIKSERFIGHIRFRMQGDLLPENTQPFLSADNTCAFASTMSYCSADHFKKDVKGLLQGKTGAEIFGRLLIRAVEDDGPASIHRVIKRFFFKRALRPEARASFVLCINNDVFVYRFRRSMYFCHRAGPFDAFPVHLRGSLHPSYELTLQDSRAPGDLTTIVATEKLTHEVWQTVPAETLLRVTPNGLSEF